MASRIQKYSEFWPQYLKEHSRPLTRRLHFWGTSLALALFVGFLVSWQSYLLILAFVAGYAFAWYAHLVHEKNRPTTFQYPLWSLVSDLRLWYLMLLRRPLR